MGTNYYLRKAKPRTVYDQMHMCKTSVGWTVHFQDSDDGWADEAPVPDEDVVPSFHSVSDIRRLLESGEWVIADEYGNACKPGKESLDKLEELCGWHGPREATDLRGSYRDDEGHLFTRTWFR